MSPAKYQTDTVPLSGILFLVGLCAIWGANIVSIKVVNRGVPPLMAAAIRSVGAAVMLWGYAALRGEKVRLRGEDRIHGIAIGVLFALEFLFLYWGMAYTNASRSIIFLYTNPFITAIGAHFFLSDDRLTWGKSVGLCMAFIGLLSVFVTRSASLGPLYWVGDVMAFAASIFWAATTIYIKKFIQNRPISHYQTLFAQLYYSIPVLVAATLIFEWGHPVTLTPLVVGVLFYQIVVVAAFSYLFWFWFIHRYPVSKLAAFSFFTPLFGVVMSGLFLGETITTLLWIGLALVAVGIVLVNRPS